MRSQTKIFSQLVRDYMAPATVVLGRRASVSELLGALGAAKRTSALVVDDDGRLAGIVTERDITRRVALRCEGGEAVESIMTAPVRAEERKKLGLPANEGVKIGGLARTGPAGKAGIKAGDILIHIAGRPVTRRTLGRVLARIGAGEPVRIIVIRAGKRIPLRLVLGERPTRRRRRP